MTECNKKLKRELSNLLRARFPYIYIPTWEEERAVSMIQQIAADENYILTVRKVYQWSQASGFTEDSGKRISSTSTPRQAVEFICKCQENALFVRCV